MPMTFFALGTILGRNLKMFATELFVVILAIVLEIFTAVLEQKALELKGIAVLMGSTGLKKLENVEEDLRKLAHVLLSRKQELENLKLRKGNMLRAKNLLKIVHVGLIIRHALQQRGLAGVPSKGN